MTISKSDVLGFAQIRTARSDILTDIDDELGAILYDICTRWPFLQKSSNVVISDGERSGDLPGDYADIAVVEQSGGDVMTEVSFLELMQMHAADSTASATASHWAEFNDDLYIFPKASGALTMIVYHSYDDDDVDDIQLPDHFRECVTEGVCWKVYENAGLMGDDPAAQLHKSAYDEQIAALTNRYRRRGR